MRSHDQGVTFKLRDEKDPNKSMGRVCGGKNLPGRATCLFPQSLTDFRVLWDRKIQLLLYPEKRGGIGDNVGGNRISHLVVRTPSDEGG